MWPWAGRAVTGIETCPSWAFVSKQLGTGLWIPEGPRGAAAAVLEPLSGWAFAGWLVATWTYSIHGFSVPWGDADGDLLACSRAHSPAGTGSFGPQEGREPARGCAAAASHRVEVREKKPHAFL